MRRIPHLVATVVGLALVLALVPGAGPAGAAPTEPLFPEQIEAYADYDGQDTCQPAFKPGVVAFAQIVLAEYPETYGPLNPRACAGGTSEHYEGRAWDWMVDAYDSADAARAKDLLDWLLRDDSFANDHALVRRLGLMYIIWNNQVWRAYDSGDGWQPYSGPNPHTDHVHFSFSWDGALQETSWTTLAELGQRLDQARVAATWRDRDRLDVFRRSRGGALQQAIWPDGSGSWIDLGGQLRSGPAAVWSSSRRLWIFAQGTDGTLHQRRWSQGSGWREWRTSKKQISSAPAVATRSGRIDVVVRTDVGSVAHRSWRPKHGWSKWDDLGGLVSAPPAVSWSSRNQLDVLARGATGQLHVISKVDRTWTAWGNLGGALTSGPATASVSSDQVTVVVRGTDGALYQRTRTGSWAGWTGLGGSHVSGPATAAIRNRRLDLLTRDVSGGTLYNTYRPGTGWTGWSLE
ncbi:MAG: hypothetical protein WKH47_00020 [Actinomycetes bacterium]